MSIVNTRDKIINTKVVYYGPGLGGKTTSLKCVHTLLDPDDKLKMVSLKTDEERTLFFDFVPLDLGVLGGYKIKIQGFTVPGQVKYNLTRKYVLMGSDAVVFVADSQKHRAEENVLAMANLGENLSANGLNINDIPLVLQYNKRDLEGLASIEEMDQLLNFRKVPAFGTQATQKMGVFDAFVAVSEIMLRTVAAKYRLDAQGKDLGKMAHDALHASLAPSGG